MARLQSFYFQFPVSATDCNIDIKHIQAEKERWFGRLAKIGTYKMSQNDHIAAKAFVAGVILAIGFVHML